MTAGLLLCTSIVGQGGLLFGQAAASASAQGLAKISGIVLEAASRTPVRDVDVSARGISVSSSTGHNFLSRSRTGPDGAFRFNDLPPGRYLLSGTRSGYPSTYYGQVQVGDVFQFFDLRPGEDATGITLWLTAGGEITGFVRSASGAPLGNKRVHALAVETISNSGGGPTITYRQPPTMTNEQGHYRLADLPPGKYLVAVSDGNPFGAPLEPFPARLDASCLFFPNAQSPAKSEPVLVRSGGYERADFTIPASTGVPKFAAGRVAGVPFNIVGQSLRLVLGNESTGIPPSLNLSETTVRSDGTFVFPYVPSGDYELRALFVYGYEGLTKDSGLPSAIAPRLEMKSEPPVHWVRYPISVREEPVRNLTIDPQPGARLRGQLVRAGDIADLDVSRMQIASRSLDGWSLQNAPSGRVEADSSFSSVPLPPGRFQIFPLAGSNGLVADSIVLGGRDVAGSGLELQQTDVSGIVMTITGLRAQVDGTVRDASGKDRPDSHIVFFRVNGAWQDDNYYSGQGDAGRTRPDRFGNYSLTIRSGEYYLVALGGSIPSDWGTSAFLRSLIPIASKISVTRGVRSVLNLSIRQIPR